MNVGKYTYGANNIELHKFSHTEKLTIGSFCSIAAKVVIFTGGNHRTDWVTTFPFGHICGDTFPGFNGQGHPASKGDVNIGNDVWIGYGVTIMSGVTIGDGAVLGAKSVVTKDVSPYSIVCGNPAKEVKKRFSSEIIEKLLEIKWWNWDEKKINDHLNILCSGDVELLIDLK